MVDAISRVGVIGAGTMGAGIAAQVANAGVEVVLLDIVKDGARRSALAEDAVARLLKTEPAAFMHADFAKRVRTGNLEDDLSLLGTCDWIVEAVIERLDTKKDLYRRIETVRRPGCAVSSNTSTIPLALLTKGMPEPFRRDFMVTHFFNPPRYMRLLELVAGPDTAPETLGRVASFCDLRLGKSVIACQDSPGFIANRLGIYWMQLGIVEAMALGLTVEQADTVFGKRLGIPKTGLFGLLDLVGIDLAPHLNASMRATLKPDDAFQAIGHDIPLIGKMIAAGLTGRKGLGGFYRMDKSGGARRMLAIDLGTGEYRPERREKLPEVEAAGNNLRGLLGAETPAGIYAFRVLAQVVAYAATLVPDAATSIADIDAAMRLGYNWKWGPFELADRIGADYLAGRLDAAGLPVPLLLRQAAGSGFYRSVDGALECLGADGAYHKVPRPDGVLLLQDVKRAGAPIQRNASAALWDIGQGVACFEFTGKSNTLDPDVLALLERTIETVTQRFKALVIYSDADNFSMGANLGLALFAANIAAWGEIEKITATGQRVFKALKYAPFPVVAAPCGMTLGGGCEIVLHADAVVAHAETYMGLVECGVGLVPGWGGCSEMLARWSADARLPRGPVPAAAKVFETVSVAQVSRSAEDARALHFLRPGDKVVMNRDRLLAAARDRALAMAAGYAPPAPPTYVLPGPSGRAGFNAAAQGFAKRGLATKHDLSVADGLAEVLSGGDADLLDMVTEQQVLDLERRVFMRLVRTYETLARVEHTLETGKPLRN